MKLATYNFVCAIWTSTVSIGKRDGSAHLGVVDARRSWVVQVQAVCGPHSRCLLVEDQGLSMALVQEQGLGFDGLGYGCAPHFSKRRQRNGIEAIDGMRWVVP